MHGFMACKAHESREKLGKVIALCNVATRQMKPLSDFFQTYPLLSAAALSIAVLTSVTSCGVVQHVPPGQSVAFAKAKKAELVALAPAAKPSPAAHSSAVADASVEPSLPASSSDVEKVADSFNLGNLCLAQGQYGQAIAAYQAALKVNPNFAEAWSRLAVAYQNAGEEKKALEAYRKSKALSLSMQ